MSRFTETRDGFVMYCPLMSRGGFMRRMDMPEQQAKRPCIYCGGGVIMADAGEEIMELSRRLDAPICHSLMGVDAVPTDFPASLGMSGMHGQYASTKAIAEAELLIAVGARFSDRAVGDKQKYAAKAKIIHKVATDRSNRQEIIDAANVFRNKIIDYSTDAITMELTGETKKLDAFIELMKEYGILELGRTGVVSLKRGDECLDGTNSRSLKKPRVRKRKTEE